MLKRALFGSVIVGMLLIILTSALQAEPTVMSDVLEQRDKMLRNFQAELGLSDQQTIEWGRIQDRYIAAHARLYEEQNRELNAILSSAQVKKYEKMQEEIRKGVETRLR